MSASCHPTRPAAASRSATPVWQARAAVAEDVTTASRHPLRLVARLHVDLLRVASARCRPAR